MEHAVIIDIRTPEEVCKNLKKLDVDLLQLPATDRIAWPISAHPDMQLFIHNKNAFVHPHIDKSFLRELERYCSINLCGSELYHDYPRDIAYNIAFTGRFALHRLDCTAPAILDYLNRMNTHLINTRQGYSKCSTLIIDDTSIITADSSIDRTARTSGMNSLLISTGHVDLPGYKYGFIGGATGRFMDMVLFTGHIDGHPDRESIYEFIESRGLKVKVLSNLKVLDTGSILVV